MSGVSERKYWLNSGRIPDAGTKVKEPVRGGWKSSDHDVKDSLKMSFLLNE